MAPQIHIALVDPFSSTQYLANQLKAQGIRTTAIYTNHFDSEFLISYTDLFDNTYQLSSFPNLSFLIAQLSTLNINYIYYGSEISTDITDKLAEILTPNFSNDPSTSHLRSNKYAMQQALLDHGIAAIKQLIVKNELTPLQEKQLADFSYPVICKPTQSAASAGVRICQNLGDVVDYLQEGNAFNIFGLEDCAHVIQEYLVGTEYFIDSFSVGGKHFISGIQRYQRKVADSKPVCMYSEVIAKDSPEGKLCIDYTNNVLNAVGMNNGFAHTEVMLTKDGPFLIEVNPRVSGAGGNNHKLFSACGYHTQIDYFIAHSKQITLPTTGIKKFGRKVVLNTSADHIVQGFDFSLLKRLPSFYDAFLLKEVGSHISSPKNFADSVGFVLLSHQNSHQVDDDYQKLMDWQSQLKLY